MIVAAAGLTQALNAKTGVVTTGNSLDHTEKDDEMMAQNGSGSTRWREIFSIYVLFLCPLDASIKDMECAAIHWVCRMFNKPLIAVKSVTDLVDGDRVSHEEFLDNLHTASHEVGVALESLVDFLIEHGVGYASMSEEQPEGEEEA